MLLPSAEPRPFHWSNVSFPTSFYFNAKCLASSQEYWCFSKSAERGTGSSNNFVRKTRDNWTGNWWKPAEKSRTNCCEVNWTGVHRQMNNSVCHFDRTRIDKWTILTVSVETKPGEESVEVMCFLSLIDCLQRGTLSTKPGQEPTTGKRNGSFLSLK